MYFLDEAVSAAAVKCLAVVFTTTILALLYSLSEVGCRRANTGGKQNK